MPFAVMRIAAFLANEHFSVPFETGDILVAIIITFETVIESCKAAASKHYSLIHGTKVQKNNENSVA